MALDRRDVALLPPGTEQSLPARTWALAAMAVFVLLAIAGIATLRRSSPNTGEIRAEDAYAAHLPITAVQLSEATNGTGGKATYVDGTIENSGNRTLTGALLQVTFATTDGSPSHRETLPLAVVRTRVPYVDLQPLAASPLLAGQQREFRLIFESVPANWDVKPPAIRVVHADLK